MAGLIKTRGSNTVVTVGGPAAQIAGYDSMAVQRAVECVKAFGGGVVRLLKGTYDIFGPIRLYDHIQLIGEGDETVLRKTDGFRTGFVVDADYGELRAEVADASGFKPGMGIQLYDDEHRFGWAVSTAVITEIQGNTLFFDEYLVRDYAAEKNGVVSNSCSIIEGVNVEHAVVSNLVIEGSKQTNLDQVDGCRGGAIYLHRARACSILGVKVRDFNGDGLSWQTTEDIVVRDCQVSGCTNFGAHPGTGSVRSLVEHCAFYENGSDGLFVCWRVQHGVFKENVMHHNGGSGINIGHKDICNLFESNHIHHNAFAGIHMRSESPINAAHGNTYRLNRIEDNGGEAGAGILINAPVKDISIEGNILRDTGQGLQHTGILIQAPLQNAKLEPNEITGHAGMDIVERVSHGY